MDSSITDLLLYIGLVLVMVAYWTFYIRYVRRIPGSEEWYDSAEPEGAESDGLLFIYPFGTLLMGAGGALGLVVSMGLPEPVEKVLGALFMAAMLIALIGFTGAFGIPLPWPFVPRWVVDIRKAKRARRRERRQAWKKREKE